MAVMGLTRLSAKPFMSLRNAGGGSQSGLRRMRITGCNGMLSVKSKGVPNEGFHISSLSSSSKFHSTRRVRLAAPIPRCSRSCHIRPGEVVPWKS